MSDTPVTIRVTERGAAQIAIALDTDRRGWAKRAQDARNYAANPPVGVERDWSALADDYQKNADELLALYMRVMGVE